MKIIAVRGDITKVDVDAVVNPGNEMREYQRRVEDKLVEQAGREVEAERVARGPLQVGDAMLTTGGKLHCRYVIHAPVGETLNAADPEGVKKSTLAALRCAARSRLRSVAIPAFPRGKTATQALLSAVRDFDKEGELDEVFIVGGSGEVVSAIKKEIGRDS